MKRKKYVLLIYFAVIVTSIFFNGVTASASSEVLKKGMSGSEVTKLQDTLKTMGFFNAQSTGYYGDLTKAAVLKFQDRYGLTEDGIAGQQVFAKINGLTAQNTAPNTDTLAPVSRGSVDRVDIRQRIVETAKKYIGAPYVWGKSGPDGFDSSGLLYYVFNSNNIKIPRHSMDIYNAGKSITKEELLPGDVVFFEGYQDGPSHGTIYAGNGYFVHSPNTGKTVSMEKLFDVKYWNSRFYGARRFVES